jgi:polysaccharide biosynthesis transport protein
MNTRQTALSANGTLPAERGLTAYQELWQIIQRRKGRIVSVMLLSMAAATIYCALSGPWYDSSAQLLVIKKRFDTAPITGPDQARVQEDYLSTHMLLITSRRVIEQAIEKGDLQSLEQFRERGGIRQSLADWVSVSIFEAEPEGRREQQLATDIINSLVVSRDAQRPGISPSNEILNLSFRGKVAADCPRILDAIIAAYQDFLKETYRNTNAETLELIAQARGMVQKDLEVKEASYQKFLAATPPLRKPQDRTTAQQDRLFRIDAKLAALRMRRAEIEASIAMIDKAIKSGRNPAATLERMSTFSATGGFGPAHSLTAAEPSITDSGAKVSLEEQLLSLQLQKARLLAIRAPNHPDVVGLSRQIDSVRQLILPSAKSQDETSEVPSKDIDFAALKIELLVQERDDLKVAEEALAKLFENEQKGVSESYMHEIQDEAHRKGIERDRLLYESILGRLKETSSVKDFGGYNTQVIGPALRGALAVKKYFLVFGLSLFAGLFLGFGWAYLVELTVKKSQASALSS